MMNKFLAALLLILVAFTGYIAVMQSMSRPHRPIETAPVVLPPVNKPVVPEPAKEILEVLPTSLIVDSVTMPSPSNHFTIPETKDHTYRFGFIGGLFSPNFPKEKINKEVVATLLDVLKTVNVNAVFLGDSINVSEKEIDLSLPLIERRLSRIYRFVRKKLGPDIRIFPVIDCSWAIAPRIMPIVNKTFHLGLKDPMEPYEVTTDTATIFVVPTHQFDPNAGLLPIVVQDLKNLGKPPGYLFFAGYDAPFPVTSYIVNDNERKAFWKLLVDAHATAYFSFREEVFNRVYHRGVWQIITGGGGRVPTEEGAPAPFYHSVLLRIPAQENNHPSVQALDIKGDVVDEFELIETNNPLHQLHISG